MKIAKLKDKDKIIEVPVIPSTIIACPFQTTRIKGENKLIDFFGKEKQFKVFLEYKENKGVVAEFLTIDEFINLFLVVRYVAEIKEDGFIYEFELDWDISEEEKKAYDLMLLEQQDYVNKIASIIRINPDILSDGKYTFLDRIHLLAGYLPDMEARKEILFERSIKTKVEKLLFHILRENKAIEWKKELQIKTQKKLDEWAKKNFLHAQMEVIKKELGLEKRVDELKKKIKEKQDILPKEVKEKLDREIERLMAISESSPEAGNIEDYINFILELPWNTYTKDNLDLAEIKKYLNNTHYGMQKAKERILEYLAVWKVKGPKSNILCMIGPQGVGKTSLSQSIAKALGRKCIQISLGGVSDPHYLKGFRRTYVGSQPSVIMQRIHLAKSKNPVIILDEIDKVGKHSIHGCYSEDTEVLTIDGWKLFKDLKLEDKLFTVNKEGKIEIHNPTKLFEYDYNGKMYHFKTLFYDLLVTPNHNMLVNIRNKEKYTLVQAKDVKRGTYSIPRQVIWKGEEKEYFILPKLIKIRQYKANTYTKTFITEYPEKKIKMDDWLAFFGIWLAEGSYKEYVVTISQNNEKIRAEIRKLLEKLPFKFAERKNPHSPQFEICSAQLASYLSLFGRSKNKFIPKEIKNLSSRQLRILWEWMMKGDGCKYRHLTHHEYSYHYSTASKKLADDFQEITMKIGYSANIRSCKKGGYDPLYQIGVHIKGKEYVIRDIRKKDYNGKVYCCTVPNHTMLVRRNGKMCWCGNSVEAALMEILDPAVNHEFRDHWVEVPFDLSNVLFILTGNYIENINPVLLDRLEVIELNGYTDIEKLYIAKDYIIPKEKKEVGINELFDVKFEDEAIIKIIKKYTNEAGVRKLDEKIRNILRKVLKDYFEKGIKKEIITKDDIEYYLQKPIYKYKLEGIGIVNGLAVSGTGGSILPIEVTLVPKDEEKQKIHISGNLKDVIKESVNIAIANVKRLYKDWPNDVDIYIHAIPGAVPKDGPSAGIAIATAVLSAIKHQKIKKNIAMTGELSLTGKVLPIGGLQEKITAAVREGIKDVLIPIGNKTDLVDIDEETKSKINIKFVKNIEEVFEFCFKE
ncbi:AAA family ATPase [bacterium]|nr:AAA family ATPase [bacterium]